MDTPLATAAMPKTPKSKPRSDGTRLAQMSANAPESKKAARERVLKAQEKKPIEEEWIPGNTLRFVPDNARVKLDPPRGYNFLGDCPVNPPAKVELPKERLRLKIGMTVDAYEGRARTVGKSRDIALANNKNEAVYMRTTAREPYFDICDSAGIILKADMVRFDAAFEDVEERMGEAGRLHYFHS